MSVIKYLEDFVRQRAQPNDREKKVEDANMALKAARTVCYQNYLICSDPHPGTNSAAFEQCVKALQDCRKTAKKTYREEARGEVSIS